MHAVYFKHLQKKLQDLIKSLFPKVSFALAAVAIALVGSEAAAKDPLPLESVPSYYGWKSLWEQGAVPENAILAGTWKYAGVGSKQACRKFALKSDKEEYNHEGIKIKNDEYAELVFDHYSLGTPSGGQMKVFGYKSKNFLGHQGPYKYRPEAPQLSFLVKSQNGHSAPDSNIALSCRYLKDKVELLICSSTLNLSVSNMWNQEATGCASEKDGFFLVWVKSR